MRFSVSWTVAGCAAVIFALAMAFSYGREARASIEQAEAAASEQENSAFCRDVGEIDAYPRCATGLNQIKRSYRERGKADAAGILWSAPTVLARPPHPAWSRAE